MSHGPHKLTFPAALSSNLNLNFLFNGKAAREYAKFTLRQFDFRMGGRIEDLPPVCVFTIITLPVIYRMYSFSFTECTASHLQNVQLLIYRMLNRSEKRLYSLTGGSDQWIRIIIKIYWSSCGWWF